MKRRVLLEDLKPDGVILDKIKECEHAAKLAQMILACLAIFSLLKKYV
jgi:hypothetical protein